MSFFCKYLVQPIGRRRRQRTVFTQNHIQQLENIFIYNQYPDIQLRESLATQMNISESRIQVFTSLKKHIKILKK